VYYNDRIKFNRRAWDVTMTDLLEGRITLDRFRGIAFVGGFSFGDVLGSSKGWAGVIRYHQEIWKQFEWFYIQSNTFSLGVCNGCQLMSLLGWVPYKGSIEEEQQPRFIHNLSGRFECRFLSVKILASPSIMLKDMEGSILGIWSAHGEGRAFFKNESILNKVLEDNLAPIRYVDELGNPTESYPFNPNGSIMGIASLCSKDGRHLALMPHPERSILKWQWPYRPSNWKSNADGYDSPWLKMFQNARKFVTNCQS
jgi:phosphoribosylformylglycinamidine synthase